MGGNHPLTWLTIPSWLWKFIIGYSGRPNRVLLHRYRALLDRLAEQGLLEYDLLVMRLAGGERIDPHQTFDEIADLERERAIRLNAGIRSRLVPEFAPVTDADLAVVGICLVIRKC